MILDELNSRETLLEADGSPAEPIVWECSCDQGVCGSCINQKLGPPAVSLNRNCSFHANSLPIESNLMLTSPFLQHATVVFLNSSDISG